MHCLAILGHSKTFDFLTHKICVNTELKCLVEGHHKFKFV